MLERTMSDSSAERERVTASGRLKARKSVSGFALEAAYGAYLGNRSFTALTLVLADFGGSS
jgi:hypothetical protein